MTHPKSQWLWCALLAAHLVFGIHPVAVGQPDTLPAPADSTSPGFRLRQQSPLRDTTRQYTNLEAIYNRPFIVQSREGRSSLAMGGYAEGNTNYVGTDGVNEGFSMEFRRMNLFMYSSIATRIRFMAELEFEHGTEEIKLEMALADFEIHPACVLRAGIVLPPLGGFNQNHDSPRWEFVERPLVSTTILPVTLSEVGFGVYGKVPIGRRFVITYEGYALNGLGADVVANSENRTSLAMGRHPEIFAEDNNGSPAFSGRAGFRVRNLGEVGISAYGGIYNSFRAEGVPIDARRWLRVGALDWRFSLGPVQVTGEAAVVAVDVPEGLRPQFGASQWGIFTDVVYPVWRFSLLGLDGVTLNIAARGEAVDYNVGQFTETGGNIADDLKSVTGGLSLRLSPSTVVRAGYRYIWHRDILGNVPARTAGINVGFATYF